MNNMIIYQLALRTFTPDGTLKAAKELIPHIASLGVDIVYVCPFYTEDEDGNYSTWSKRQKASGTYNPKNPYKIIDYFNVDPEYGTNEDLKEFVDEVHKHNLFVMFDLVYLHCGKNAVFAEEHPDFLVRNEDGSIMVPSNWPFARLNFDNKELRSYLISNMEYLAVDVGCDGFRCDVGDGIPLDFWDEAFSYIKKKKPELITLNEGIIPEYLDVFDWCYGYEWRGAVVDIFANGKPAYELQNHYKKQCEKYGCDVNRVTSYLDSHDTASDCGMDRNEIIMTGKGVEAAIVLTNTYPGVSFMWNGTEICDDAENNMFSNRFHGKRSTINWSKAMTEKGKDRIELVKKIHHIHHTCDAIKNGDITWLETSAPEEIIAFTRESDTQKLLVVINTKNIPVAVNIQKNAENTIISSGCEYKGNSFVFEPYGYIVAKINL